MNKPFLLKPVGKDYIWGGSTLKEKFNKDVDMTPLAETWECSVHPDGLSVVCGGEFDGMTLKEVLEIHPEYMGERLKNEKELPILVKFIDAKEDLSIQVHPNDEYAFRYENGQRGKTEMWYVLEAVEKAEIVFGLNTECNASVLMKAIEDKTIANYLQRVKVKKGDVFFVEPGTVHAVLKGCVIAEIQESSNLTYRLYDYDRTDRNGKKRELHLQKALEVMNFKPAGSPRQPLRVLRYKRGIAEEFLTRCSYFETYRMLLNTQNEDESVTVRADEISLRILLCVDGNGAIEFGGEKIVFTKGDCIFVPANSEVLKLEGRAEILDVRA